MATAQAQSATHSTEDEDAKKRAAKAKEIFDKDEAKAKENGGPWTAQVDQLKRSAEMEEVGASAWMTELERRIRERQGDPPIEPRQVHGVAQVKAPGH